jgi:hypothetical protein
VYPAHPAELLLQPYLRPGERLLWSGGPDPSVWLAPADVTLIPLSIVWALLSVFFWFATLSGGSPEGMVPATLWVVAGFYMIAGRFFYKRRMKQRTVYGVTTQRAMVLVSRRALADVPLQFLPANMIWSRDNRHLTIIFGFPEEYSRNALRPGFRPSWMYVNTGFPRRRNTPMPIAFFDVAEPEAMLTALDQARSGQVV